MKVKSISKANLAQKKVLLRADLNVPIKNKKVADVTRIKELKGTIDLLLKQKAKVAVCSHLGRPDGQINQEFSLKQLVKAIEKELKVKVIFVADCVSPKIPQLLAKLSKKEILLLENTRFYPQEELNDKEFSNTLAAPFDVYVNDAFGTAHRAHASTEGVTHFLKSYAGLLIEKELKCMGPLIDPKKLKKPLTVIVSGSKIDTKIGVIKQFLGLAENILIGGALANTFLLAQGYQVGKSLVENDKVAVATEILTLAKKKKTNLLLPLDVIVSTEISPKALAKQTALNEVSDNEIILDIGKQSISSFIEVINNSETIVVNGPIGLYELDQFSTGTKKLFKAISNSKAFTVIGGGDTIDAVTKFKISAKKFDHVSTGGGAMIEFLEGKVLPGITPLLS